jgi:tetratricopeptide (TPR) repeat protein
MGLLLVPLALLLVAAERNGAQLAAAGAWRRSASPAVRRTLLWGVLGVAWLAALIVYWWLRQAAGVGQPVMQQLGWPDRLERLAAAAAYYLVKAVAPWPQSNFVTWDMVPGRAATAMLLLAAAALAAWSFRVWRRRGDGTALLAVAWFAGTLTLALWNAVGTMNNTPLAERHLYLPSVAMAIGVGLAYQAGRARGWSRLPACLVVALIAVYLVSSVQRAITWRSSIALWANVTERVTDYAMPWTSLAIAELRAGNEQRALELLLRAIATRDEPWGRKERGLAHNDIGKIYLRRGEVGLAEQHLRQSTTLVPAEAEPWFQLATIYARQVTSPRTSGTTEQRDARAELAIKAFTAALTRDPANHEARLRLAGFLFNYGELLEGDGRAAPALRRYRSALDQLQIIMASIPEQGRESSLARLAGLTSIEPGGLQHRLETHIERLGAPGNGGRL